MGNFAYSMVHQLNIGNGGFFLLIIKRQIDCLHGDIRNNKLVLFRSSSPAMLVWFSTKDNCTHIPNGRFSASYRYGSCTHSLIFACRAFKEEENCVVLPTASIIGGKCVGDTVQISFTGTPPWQLTYLEGWVVLDLLFLVAPGTQDRTEHHNSCLFLSSGKQGVYF